MSAEELKGAALDQALEAAGLAKWGTADEKRARLAQHQAATTSGDAEDAPVDEQADVDLGVTKSGTVETTSGDEPGRKPAVGDVWRLEVDGPVEIHRPDERVITLYPTDGRVSHVLDVAGKYVCGDESITVKA